MQKNFFRMVVLGSAVFAASHSINLETAQAGSVLDISSFTKQHSGKINSLLKKYGLESVNEKYLKTDDDKNERRTSTYNSSNNDDKWDLDDLLSRRTLPKLR